jgi:fructosamine-3-kinase
MAAASMNVQEQELREKIDPFLTPPNLSEVASQALGTRVKASGYRVLTGGCWNRVIAVPTDTCTLVFKISPRTGDTSLTREYSVLEVFARDTSLPVATPHLVDLDGSVIPGSVIVESLIPGEVMHHVFDGLDQGSQERISGEIADYLIELHTHKAQGFGGVECDESDRYEVWADFWIPRFVQVVDEVEAGDFVSEKMLEEIKAATEGFPEKLAIGETGTLTHYDIWAGNVMIDGDANPPKVTGFIDIPGYYADYAREISFMHVFGMADDRFFRRYARSHPLDPGFILRLNIYSLRTHLKHITMYPRESYYRQGALDCLRYIQEHGA